MLFDIKREDQGAIHLVLLAMGKALFPLLEGQDHRNLAQAEVQLSDLRRRLVKYQEDLDRKTAEDMRAKVSEASMPVPAASPICDKSGKKK